jgi:ubiquinol-cytochrome c reductase cytochrome c1 subunit
MSANGDRRAIMTPFRTLAAAALALAAVAPAALAAEIETHIEDHAFSFEGPFGVFKQAQLQRGFQVYREACATCHGMKYIAFRHLSAETGPGFPDEVAKAIAAEYEFPTVEDPDTMRPGALSDYLPTPEYFGDGVPPDLSLIAKARAGFHGPYGSGINQLFRGTGGPEYVYSLMTGYRDTPECAVGNEPSGYYNIAFAPGGFPDSCIDDHGHRMVPGSWIAMPPPISDGIVTYADGTDATEKQVSEDIAAFLMWAAEPKMMERKEAGLRNIVWLVLLAVLLFYVNKRVWSAVKGDHA